MPDGSKHAFRYTGTPGSGGVMADLGTLGTDSYGDAVNTAGQVVGTFFTAGGAEHAFLYTGTPGVDGRMIDLVAWLDANDPADGAKWTLTGASGLSDTGLITGSGEYNDGVATITRAFLLDARALVVPEPGGLTMLFSGALAIGGLFRIRFIRARTVIECRDFMRLHFRNSNG
jgi:probable HAF family extracellular repeat protein